MWFNRNGWTKCVDCLAVRTDKALAATKTVTMEYARAGEQPPGSEFDEFSKTAEVARLCIWMLGAMKRVPTSQFTKLVEMSVRTSLRRSSVPAPARRGERP